MARDKPFRSTLPVGVGGTPGPHTHAESDVTNLPTDLTAAKARANHTGTQTASTISDFSTAADARVAAAVGVSVQGFDADLSAIAGLTPTTGNVIQSVAGAWASRTMAQLKVSLGVLVADIADFATGADARIAAAAATGTGNLVRATSPTLVTPALGTPASGTLTNCTGLPESGVTNLVADLGAINTSLAFLSGGSTTGSGTLVGPVYETSVPGVGHPTIMLDGPNNLMKFYAGLSGETNGYIDPAAFGGTQPALKIAPGKTATYTRRPNITMYSATGVTAEDAGNVTVNSDELNLFGTTSVVLASSVAGSVSIQGPTVVSSGTLGATMGAGSVGTGTFRDSVDARVAAIAVARCHVGYRGTVANQTMNASTWTTMNLAGTADHDIGSGFSKASDIVTITNAGTYQLHGFVPFNVHTGNVRDLLRIETWTGSDPGVGLATAVAFDERLGGTVTNNYINCQGQRTFAAGAKVRLIALHTQGTSITTLGGTNAHQLNIARLS